MGRSTSSKTGDSSKFPEARRAPMDSELYARLQAEAKAPYRSLRRFIYIAFGASGALGALIFISQLISGQSTQATLGNLAVQVGVIALMVYLFRIDRVKN